MLINQRHYNPGLQGTQQPPPSHPTFCKVNQKLQKKHFYWFSPFPLYFLLIRSAAFSFLFLPFFYIYIKSCIYVSVCQQRQEALKPLQFLSYCVILVIYSSNQTLKQVIIIKDYIEQILHMKPYFLNKYLLLLITSIS